MWRSGIERIRRLLESDVDARWFLVGWLVLLPAFLAPLFATPILPSLDGPFHLAIADMLAKSGDASPYAAFYQPRVWPVPPALPWAVLALLGKVVSGTTAMRVLVGLYVATLPLGVASFARSSGGAASPALLAFPLAYNLALHYGFLGYVLSLPALFGMLACTAALLRSGKIETAVLLAFCALVLFGLHLETYAIGLVAAIAMIALSRTSSRLIAAIAFAPSIVLLVSWHAGTPWLRGPAHRTLGDAWSALVATRRAEIGDRSIVSDLASRIAAIPTHLLRGFRDGADEIASYALLAIVLVLVASLISPRLRAEKNHPLARARPCLLAIAFAGYLVLPHHFDAYEAMSVAPRLAPLVLCAAIASIPLRITNAIASKVLYGATLALGLAYSAVLVREYRAFAVETADFQSVVMQVPAGGRVVGLVFDGESSVMEIDSIVRGLPSAYVALRPAPSSMVALRYCGMRHFPCVPRAAVPAPDPWAPEAFDVTNGFPFFDYVLARGTWPASLPHEGLVEIARSGSWVAYRTPRSRSMTPSPELR